VSTPANTVHVRVNDRATGQATPVRLRLSNPEGEYFAPLGRLTEFATGRNQDVGGNLRLGHKAYAFIDGTCEVRLPGGRLLVDLYKGFEYLPCHVELDHPTGKISLRLEIERWIDLRRDGWYSGDTRAHFLTPHAALLEGAAEDLAVVNLLAVEHSQRISADHEIVSIPNILAFSGQAPALERPGHMVVVNTHNVHPALGSLALLHCHRPVYPLSFGSEGDNRTLADWCQQCHRKQGLVVWTDTAHETPAFRYGEPLADLLLGNVDAFEISFFEDSPFDVLSDWYALLNCGLCAPLAGSSAKDSNCVGLGAMRTYARLAPGEELTCKNWIEALRSGRTFVTNCPLVSMTVGGRDPGAVLKLPEGGTAAIRIEARSALAFERLELLVNGKVEATATASGEPIATTRLDVDLPIAGPCWIAARCQGSKQILGHPSNQRVFAHTSPVYVEVDGKPFPRDADAAGRFDRELDRMAAWAQHEARCECEFRREQLVEVFRLARAKLHDR
jgi:hypothetical protein